MSQPFTLDVTNYDEVSRIQGGVDLGHYFVFMSKRICDHAGGGRLDRLLVSPRGGRVLPLAGAPVYLPGVTITPHDRSIHPLASVVCDRDLYRAEQDTVNLFIAAPALECVRLAIECHGEPFSERDIELEGGTAIETLAMLLPGSFTAQLIHEDQPLGQAASFTVAEYTLAPLSARLLSHELGRDALLKFTLAVDSYQVPFAGRLRVALVEGGREITSTKIKADSPGRYHGKIRFPGGEGPFRLRLTAVDDAERIAEVALPGSRKSEREATVVSELGREITFAMMPEPGALPLRGGFLSDGDYLATPLIVEEVVTRDPLLRASTNIDDLALVCIDLTTGAPRVQLVGPVAAGETVRVEGTTEANTLVVAGGLVNDLPFEGFTTFVSPGELAVNLNAPSTVRPHEDLVLEVARSQPGPVLLCVRDERLTATDTPAVALGSALKRGVELSTAGMSDAGLVKLELPMPEAWEDVITLEEMPMDVDFAAEELAEGSAAPPVMLASTRDRKLARARAGEVQRSSGILGGVAQGVGALFDRSPATTAKGAKHEHEHEHEQTTAEDREVIESSGEPTVDERLRSDFPEVLFYGLVPVQKSTQVAIPLADSLGTFTVEAFAVDGGDWIETRATVMVDQPVRVDLDLPPVVQRGDQVAGRLRVATASGRARVTLTRDGKPISLENGDTFDTPYETQIDVEPGLYCAAVEDPASHETDCIETRVNEPGKLRSQVRELGLLQPADQITLDSANALSLRVLPGIETSFDMLVTATAGYAHLCCEQTAAKILSATFMYLAAEKAGQRKKAEQIILAGIAREKKMLRPKQGFAMYPGKDTISDHYSRLAVRYLWHLRQLDQAPDLPSNLRRAIRQGIELADTAAAAHRMDPIPKRIDGVEAAYAACTQGGDVRTARNYVMGFLDFSGAEVRLCDPRHRVANRASLAYAAACLIAAGDLERGIRAANQVTRELNEQGCLYSTVDSVAAIALMIQLRVSGVLTAGGRVRLNGRELSTAEAASFSDQVETLEVLEGIAPVEVVRIHEEDWGSFANAFPVRIGFRDGNDRKVKRFAPGDRVDLMVSLPAGYQAGDLVHVSLPAALAWIQGGGKVKQFTLDFEGKDELRVPVVVTSPISGKQHFAVCVRNMFEEERATSPGVLSING